MKKRIIWASQHFDINPLSGRLESPEELEELDEIEEEFQDIEQESMMLSAKSKQMMATPFGLWSVDDTMHPLKQFKLWMGHTNFNLSPKIINMLQDIPGVEILRVLTRYRFLVGFGESFEPSEVKINIEAVLCGLKTYESKLKFVQNDTIKAVINQKISSNNGLWSFFLFPNGVIADLDPTSSDEAVSELEHATNGLFLTNVN